MIRKNDRVPRRILVIRLSALGDLIMCGQAFQDIRAAYPTAHIALLTMPGFEGLARLMPWFDAVLVDPRPSLKDGRGWWNLVRRVRHYAPDLVIDFQGKLRQTILYAFLGGPLGIRWSGAAPLCTLPRPWPPSPSMHYTDFAAAQLRAAHIPQSDPVTYDWLAEPLPSGVLPPSPYVVLVVGCAPTRPYKRWPVEHFSVLATRLLAQGITPVVVGAKAEKEIGEAIIQQEPRCVNLVQATNLPQLATLMRGAVGVVGNDTGPTHIAGAVGAATVALISGRVNARWIHPLGPWVRYKQCDPLGELSVDDIAAELFDLITQKKKSTDGKGLYHAP